MRRAPWFAALLLAGLTALLGFGHPFVDPGTTVIVYATMFLPYAGLLLILRSGAAKGDKLPRWGLLIGAAVVCRLLLVFVEPLLSDDIFRYVWEGRVTLAGHNPFILAPSAAELAHFRDATIWASVGHREVSAIYPPVAQYLFAINALWDGGTTSMRLLMLLVEAGFLWGVWRVLGAGRRLDAGSTKFMFAIYALNPLVFVEVAWSGHLDVIAWMPLVVGLLAWWRGDDEPGWKASVLAGVLLGISIAAKFLGVIALPLLLFGRRYHLSQRVTTVAIALAVVVLSYVPFAAGGTDVFGGFGTYAAKWRSNDGGYRLVHELTEKGLEHFASEEDRMVPGDPSTQAIFRFPQWNGFFLERGWTKEWQGQTLPDTSFAADQIAQFTAKAFAAMVMGFALLWCLLAERDPLKAFPLLLLVLFFVAPTVHPWYVAWLIPFAALRPTPWSLVFSGAVVVSYGAWASAMQGGEWAMPWWVVASEYLLVVGVVLWRPTLGTNVVMVDPSESKMATERPK